MTNLWSQISSHKIYDLCWS